MNAILPWKTGTINSVRASVDTLMDHQKNWPARRALGRSLSRLVYLKRIRKSGVYREAAGVIASLSGKDLTGDRVIAVRHQREMSSRVITRANLCDSLRIITRALLLQLRREPSQVFFQIICQVAPTINWYAIPKY